MKRNIEGYEDYWVDDEGRVWSNKSGEIKELKGINNNDGYLRVSLCKNGKWKWMSIHRLVAMAFLDNPEKYEQVNHKNGIKTDNRLENLEWCNNSQNMKHAYSIGLKKAKGSKNGYAKITDEEAIKIFNRLNNGESPTEIAKDYPITRQAIYEMKWGKTWSHIPRTPKK